MNDGQEESWIGFQILDSTCHFMVGCYDWCVLRHRQYLRDCLESTTFFELQLWLIKSIVLLLPYYAWRFFFFWEGGLLKVEGFDYQVMPTTTLDIHFGTFNRKKEIMI